MIYLVFSYSFVPLYVIGAIPFDAGHWEELQYIQAAELHSIYIPYGKDAQRETSRYYAQK